MTVEVPDYGYQDAAPRHTARYLLPQIKPLFPPGKPLRVLDVGCGSGYNASQYAAMGHQVVGIDLAESGISNARKSYPGLRFEVVEAGANFLEALREPPFDVVTSTEVVEHLYDPRSWARACYAALKPGGRLICTTPYHGYLKNLALAAFNKMDWHLNPLWDGGHIKFWSRKTLSQLLIEAGFTNVQFRGAGRAPYLWMSMVIAGDRPAHNESPS